MYVVGDVVAHEKLSTLKDGKHTNFIRTMNAFSLVICSLISGCCVAVNLSEVLCG